MKSKIFFFVMIMILFITGINAESFTYNRADLMKLLKGERNLQGADLRGAELVLMNLIGANLSEANLSAADLRRAELQNAQLRSTNFSRANLSSAILNHANLTGAVLQNTIIKDISVINAKIPIRYKDLFAKNNIKNLETVIWVN